MVASLFAPTAFAGAVMPFRRGEADANVAHPIGLHFAAAFEHLPSVIVLRGPFPRLDWHTEVNVATRRRGNLSPLGATLNLW